MGWKQKAKELFTAKEVFYLLTITILGFLLPLSFLLLATLSGVQYFLQSLTWFHWHSPEPFSFVFHLALYINPCILYVLVAVISITTLVQGLMGKITLLSDSSSPLLQLRLYVAWILLCAFQVCVGLGIEGSIAAGLYDDDDSSFGPQRGLLSRVVFLLGLHETTQVWCRMVVRPVVDDTVFGFKREEKWIEKVGMAGCLGTLWWWRLREEVEKLVVMAEEKKEESMDVGMSDFVGWWLYYLIVTIGMVRIVKGIIWMLMISLCRRRVTESSPLEASQNNDHKV
ncbi:uncharacterized protein LOC113873495 [Abrus precatorius]|uniref:Uncharacterized protein LOC113873495 n=1 Tax=Abrus precatorius TaxID=3816 RepID=A0A8B8MIH9_ABRPR|nr:uncharacterized protein LOC113873495 [Abrus precatorius]